MKYFFLSAMVVLLAFFGSMAIGCASKHRAANIKESQDADYRRPKRAMGAKFCWLWPSFADDFGLVITPTSSRRSEYYADIPIGFISELHVDIVLHRYFSAGPFVSFLYTYGHIDSDYDDDGEIKVGAVGGRFKGRFQLSREFELRPGLSLGYSIFMEKPVLYSTHQPDLLVQGFVLGLSLEGAYYFTQSVPFLIDLGVYFVPIAYEGEVGYYFRIGPLLYLGIGIEIGS